MSKKRKIFTKHMIDYIIYLYLCIVKENKVLTKILNIMISQVLSTPFKVAHYIHGIFKNEVRACLEKGVTLNNVKDVVSLKFLADYCYEKIVISEELYDFGLRCIELTNPYKVANLLLDKNLKNAKK